MNIEDIDLGAMAKHIMSVSRQIDAENNVVSEIYREIDTNWNIDVEDVNDIISDYRNSLKTIKSIVDKELSIVEGLTY